jgi:hypothetical protein
MCIKGSIFPLSHRVIASISFLIPNTISIKFDLIRRPINFAIWCIQVSRIPKVAFNSSWKLSVISSVKLRNIFARPRSRPSSRVYSSRNWIREQENKCYPLWVVSDRITQQKRQVEVKVNSHTGWWLHDPWNQWTVNRLPLCFGSPVHYFPSSYLVNVFGS